MGWTRLALTLALRALRHPATGVALLRVGWRFRRRGWWHRVPFLPLPARDYLRWRMQSDPWQQVLDSYGEGDVVPPAADVERYARWAVRDP